MQALNFYWPFIKLGATDVWRHKTRSFLTMLGMVFGVGSVIAMLAVGEGASHQALESIKRLGSQNIMVNSVKPTSEEGSSSAAQASARLAVYGLLNDDEARIRETVPGVERTVPARMVRRNARFNERQLELRVVETVPDWFEVVPRPILAGRVLHDIDLSTHANVCVLTEFGVRKLLAAEEMLGQRVRLGSGVFEVIGSTSTAAIGVACHEAGHAVQYAQEYAPIKLRAAIIPVTNFGSQLAMPLILLGLVLSAFGSMSDFLIYLGIACFGLSLVFQLVTLPVEFNASRRALAAIEDGQLLTDEELTGARKTLRAAALTYVAATAVALSQLLRLLTLFGGRRRND